VEHTDVRFEGVLAYHFRDSLGGILIRGAPADGRCYEHGDGLQVSKDRPHVREQDLGWMVFWC
jgi:hypothetical protein